MWSRHTRQRYEVHGEAATARRLQLAVLYRPGRHPADCKSLEMNEHPESSPSPSVRRTPQRDDPPWVDVLLRQRSAAADRSSVHFHLVGIGGSGLSAIAGFLLDRGYTVTGLRPAAERDDRCAGPPRGEGLPGSPGRKRGRRGHRADFVGCARRQPGGRGGGGGGHTRREARRVARPTDARPARDRRSGVARQNHDDQHGRDHPAAGRPRPQHHRRRPAVTRPGRRHGLVRQYLLTGGQGPVRHRGGRVRRHVSRPASSRWRS